MSKAPPSATGKLPLRVRLRAWWNGYELRVKRRAGGEDEEAHHQVRYERERQAWETARVEIKQQVWGPGYCGPGDPAFVRELVQPMGLNEEKSVLEIGSGLGGPARTVVEDFGAWVTGLEGDQALAEAAAALSNAAGMGKRAVIQHCDLETFEVKPRGFDAVFSKETFFQVHNKERLLEVVARALKPGGQFLFTDLMLKGEGGESEALAQWRAAEPATVSPWTIKQYRRALKELNFETRVAEDITERVRPMVIETWSRFVEKSRSGGFSDEMAQVLAGEIELWTRRTAALDSGDLRICRIYALAKEKTKLLSDW